MLKSCAAFAKNILAHNVEIFATTDTAKRWYGAALTYTQHRRARCSEKYCSGHTIMNPRSGREAKCIYSQYLTDYYQLLEFNGSMTTAERRSRRESGSYSLIKTLSLEPRSPVHLAIDKTSQARRECCCYLPAKNLAPCSRVFSIYDLSEHRDASIPA